MVSAPCVRCVWRCAGYSPCVSQCAAKPQQSVGGACRLERTHPGVLPEVLAQCCRKKLEIPRVPRGDEVAVNNDLAVLPDSTGLYHNRLDGEFSVLVGRELTVARKASNTSALNDAGVCCEERAATDAGDQLVRRRNRPHECLDALVLTQDNRALRPAGNEDAIKISGIDGIDGMIHGVGADLLEVAIDLHGSLGRGHHIDA